MEQSNNKKDFSISITIIVAIIICLILWIGGMFVSHWYANNYFDVACNEGNKFALFGDSFGSVNALISAFAFAGVIVAIVIQRNELRLQRKDLELQRTESEKQNLTLQLQRFDNTFFNMLGLQQEIVNNLYYKQQVKETVVEDAPNPAHGRIAKEVLVNKIIQGRELFRFTFEEQDHYYKNETNNWTKVRGMKGYIHFAGAENYNNSYTPSYFDHYFRHLYTIIKFIDNSNFLSFDEKYKYTTIVRATLSRYELIWLYYNGLSDIGKQKFKKLIEEYSLLKNIREDLLSICKENSSKLTANNLGIKSLIDQGFSGTDYEFFLTDNNSNTSYNIKAFYNKNELDKGRDLIRCWQKFCIQHKL
jgi:hypothetical protein